MRIINKTRNITLSDNCENADTFFKRFIGLMFRTGLPEGSALLLKPCNSIHTFFMRFTIDVIYIDRNNTIVRIRRGLRPWRVTAPVKGAASVIEFLAGTAAVKSSEQGDQLEIKS
jgi:uncharacterized protein